MLGKKSLLTYGLISLFVSIACMGQVNAAEYENYYGIEMTNEEYNTLLNLGFTTDEIYYMNEETYLENKDADATLLSKNEKYYKTIYTDLNGNPHSVEITEEEYQNQPNSNTRGIVTTEYKQMTSTLSQNGNKYRFKVSLSWRSMPSTKSYDIIGVGFEDDVYIDSSVYFNFYWCNSSGTCTTDASYYNKKKTSTGGSAVFDFPDSARSLSATLYYDVSKNTSSTINSLRMCGDYAHAKVNVSVSNISDYLITINGLELGSSIVGSYDAIPCAISTWSGSW